MLVGWLELGAGKCAVKCLPVGCAPWTKISMHAMNGMYVVEKENVHVATPVFHTGGS